MVLSCPRRSCQGNDIPNFHLLENISVELDKSLRPRLFSLRRCTECCQVENTPSPISWPNLSLAFAMMVRNHFMSEGLSHASWLNHLLGACHPRVLDCRRLMWLRACLWSHDLPGLPPPSCLHLTLGFLLGCDWVSTMNVSLKPDFSFGSSFSDFLWLQTGAPWGHVLNF